MLPLLQLSLIRAKFCLLQYTVICQISSVLVYCVAFHWQKTPNFTAFSTLAFFVGDIQRRRDKVERSCTTTKNLPLSTDIKTIFLLKRLLGYHQRKLNFTIQKSVIDKKQNTELPHPRPDLNSQPHQTWRGDRGGMYHSWTLNRFHIRRIILPLEGAQNFGKKQTPNLIIHTLSESPKF